MTDYDRPLTPKQIRAVKDENSDFSDIPELDEQFWSNASLVEPDRTEQVTMRVKRSVLDFSARPERAIRLASIACSRVM